jgi:hypothetical protein
VDESLCFDGYLELRSWFAGPLLRALQDAQDLDVIVDLVHGNE